MKKLIIVGPFANARYTHPWGLSSPAGSWLHFLLGKYPNGSRFYGHIRHPKAHFMGQPEGSRKRVHFALPPEWRWQGAMLLATYPVATQLPTIVWVTAAKSIPKDGDAYLVLGRQAAVAFEAKGLVGLAGSEEGKQVMWNAFEWEGKPMMVAPLPSVASSWFLDKHRAGVDPEVFWARNVRGWLEEVGADGAADDRSGS